jgi:glutamate:GABA antiporter
MPERQHPVHLKRELGLRDLILFAIACIVGPRWISVAASAGPGSVILWIAAAVLFAAPLGVAVAALIHKHPDAGGLYAWTRHDFGPWHGFLCFWIYWFGIALTLPNSAMFAMSMSAYALGPKYAYLADNQTFVVLATFVSIWIALGTNIVGLKIGKWTENLGGITAWMLGFLLVGVSVLVLMRRGSATPMNTPTHFAVVWNGETLGFFGAMAFGLSGMEAIGLMAAEIRNPRRTVIPATWVATVFNTAFYAASTLALLVLIKPASISELHGLADGSDVAAGILGWRWLTPLIAVIVLVNSIGGWGGLGAAVSRMPYAAGVDHLLPPAFARLHPKWATPYLSILVFGGVASALLFAVQLGDSLRAAYQALLSLMVLSGFIPYLYLFASAWKAGHRVAAGSGIAMTLLTIVSSAIPTGQVGNIWLFEGKLLAGTALMIGTAWLVYSRRRPMTA